MGNYLFNTCRLLHILREGRRQKEIDFGCQVLPRLLEDHRVFAYDKDYVRIGRGAHLRRAVVDRHNLVAEGTSIGYDADRDRERFTVSPGGVVVVRRAAVPSIPGDRQVCVPVMRNRLGRTERPGARRRVVYLGTCATRSDRGHGAPFAPQGVIDSRAEYFAW
jgi:hypothetical protein